VDSETTIEQFNKCCNIRNSNCVFYYSGYFSQNIINAIGDAVRLRLERSDTPGGVRRKLFSTFIEMAQNIVHYSSNNLTPIEQADRELRAGSVCVMQENGQFFIMCANPVTPEWAEHLRRVLEPLCDMSAEQIRYAYRRQLRKPAPDDSKGAGLGFLTIAKESSRPIEFSLEPNETGMVTFSLKATI